MHYRHVNLSLILQPIFLTRIILAIQRSDLLDKITDWQEVIAFRNIVIHPYDKLNDGIVFDAAINDAPCLQNELENILRDLDNKKS